MAKKQGSSGKVQKKGREIPKILTYDEMDRLLLAVRDVEDLLAVRIMLFAGLRVGECAVLRVGDVDVEGCNIHVRHGKGDKERYSPVDVGTAALVRAYSLERKLGLGDRLFARAQRTIQGRITDIGESIGLEEERRGCHALRHTCATWQIDQGIDLSVVKDNLGHEKVETTQIYLHLDIRKRVRTYREASRFA